MRGRLVNSHIFGPTKEGDDEAGSFGLGYMMPLTSSIHFLLVSSLQLLSAGTDPWVSFIYNFEAFLRGDNRWQSQHTSEEQDGGRDKRRMTCKEAATSGLSLVVW